MGASTQVKLDVFTFCISQKLTLNILFILFKFINYPLTILLAIISQQEQFNKQLNFMCQKSFAQKYLMSIPCLFCFYYKYHCSYQQEPKSIVQMRRVSNEQSMNTIWLHQLPVCQLCEMTEEMAKCDVYQSEKQKCNLVMCKKCQEKYPERQCDQPTTGCKKKVKQHRLKNRFKQKIKNTINSRFQLESKLRKQLTSDKYASKIDDDMAHILAALLGENNRVFNATYKKDIDKLVEELKRNEFTIESQIDRGNLPVYKATVQNNNPTNDGKIACGYPHEDYSKGINQIFQCFF